jgi:selenocysteine lyase/cysteine desulfurase
LHGRSPHDVAAALADRGLFLSHGDYYATTVAERYGRAEGFLRIGLSVYSTASEVDRVLRALAEAAA